MLPQPGGHFQPVAVWQHTGAFGIARLDDGDLRGADQRWHRQSGGRGLGRANRMTTGRSPNQRNGWGMVLPSTLRNPEIEGPAMLLRAFWLAIVNLTLARIEDRQSTRLNGAAARPPARRRPAADRKRGG